MTSAFRTSTTTTSSLVSTVITFAGLLVLIAETAVAVGFHSHWANSQLGHAADPHWRRADRNNVQLLLLSQENSDDDRIADKQEHQHPQQKQQPKPYNNDNVYSVDSQYHYPIHYNRMAMQQQQLRFNKWQRRFFPHQQKRLYSQQMPPSIVFEESVSPSTEQRSNNVASTESAPDASAVVVGHSAVSSSQLPQHWDDEDSGIIEENHDDDSHNNAAVDRYDDHNGLSNEIVNNNAANSGGDENERSVTCSGLTAPTTIAERTACDGRDLSDENGTDDDNGTAAALPMKRGSTPRPLCECRKQVSWWITFKVLRLLVTFSVVVRRIIETPATSSIWASVTIR